MKIWKVFAIVFAVGLGFLLLGRSAAQGGTVELLNVSFDTTRELYRELGERFTRRHPGIVLRSSHGPSGAQARAVIGGLKADIVSLALGSDIDALADRGFVTGGRVAPFTSTIVLIVRKGNPKGIRGWDDLVRGDVSVITPNPKTSGGARWNFLAAWGHVTLRGGSEEKAFEFVRRLFARVPVLDTGARASTTTFAQKGIGDVLIAWESEARLALKEVGGLEIVMPEETILAEPPVAIVDRNVDARGTRAAAEAFVQFLHTDEAQEAIGRHGFRPVTRRGSPFTLEQVAGTWRDAQKKFFSDGALFDRIYP